MGNTWQKLTRGCVLQLTNLYATFAKLVDKFNVYKVETIGDGYMIAAGEAETLLSAMAT